MSTEGLLGYYYFVNYDNGFIISIYYLNIPNILHFEHSPYFTEKEINDQRLNNLPLYNVNI